MKKFSLKANLVAGVSTTVEQLKPDTMAEAVGGDALEAVKVSVHLVGDLNSANKDFMDEVTRVQKLKEEKVTEYRKQYDEKTAEATAEDKAKIGNELNAACQKELNDIQATSKADGEAVVTVELSDEKHYALTKLFRKTVALWTSPKLFVEAGEAIDGAVEC